jgi:hypothetical protein
VKDLVKADHKLLKENCNFCNILCMSMETTTARYFSLGMIKGVCSPKAFQMFPLVHIQDFIVYGSLWLFLPLLRSYCKVNHPARSTLVNTSHYLVKITVSLRCRISFSKKI